MLHNKQHLRSVYLKKRAAISREQALRASRLVTENLLAFSGLKPGCAIAGYYPMRNELDVTLTLTQLHSIRHKTALPVIVHTHSPLVFHVWNPGDTLVASALFKNVLEPSHSTPMILPDAILVPLLAFDRRGYRLGYGSGMYDRTIKHLREQGHQVMTIGIGYSIQEAEDLPHIAFDQKVDYLITERETIKCRG